MLSKSRPVTPDGLFGFHWMTVFLLVLVWCPANWCLSCILRLTFRWSYGYNFFLNFSLIHLCILFSCKFWFPSTNVFHGNLWYAICCGILQWTFHPLILKSKRFYTVLIWCRVLAFLGVSGDYIMFYYDDLI